MVRQYTLLCNYYAILLPGALPRAASHLVAPGRHIVGLTEFPQLLLAYFKKTTDLLVQNFKMGL